MEGIPTIRFVVPGEPAAQPRAKATVFAGRARMYTPTTPAKAFKETARIKCAEAHTGAPLDGPLALTVRAVFSRTKGETWKKKPMPRAWHAKKPDADNVIKALKDALTGIAWRDDSQVAVEFIEKVIAHGTEQPHTTVTIEAIAHLSPPLS